ncbi:uncharacterized protein [Montipora foliosa]|uniref:uncharacterized protein isoform X2 n=1 Tax=Montipora foliosa TaxID=591990 RepID=UPI0035F214F2
MELYRHTHWCKVVFFISLLHCVWGDCIDWDLGMENGLIPNERITVPGFWVDDPKGFGRLNDVRGSWCAPQGNEYLQIDLQSLHVICAVATQGNGATVSPSWVKTYTLQSSIDNKRWTNYTENGLVKIFDGNNDAYTAKKNVLSNVLTTRWLRFVVKESYGLVCMRTEVYGVKQKPENIVAGKSTTQSSIYSDDYSNGTSDKAVDGNPDQEFKNGHCSRTLEDDPSWWRVDLSSPVQVFEVRIVTGNSPSSDGSNVTRNQVYDITLGDSVNVTNNPVCARWNGSFEQEASLVCHMNPPRSGRYVGILTSRKQFLQLCEVEIFSKGNLAFKKPTGTPYSPNRGGLSVDGNLGTWPLLLWWYVDLGRMVPVNEVILYCVIFDCPSWRYCPYCGDLVVRVASTQLSTLTEEGQECQTPVKDRIYEEISRFRTLCWPSVLGRRVTLTSRGYLFSLPEVEVYSAHRGCQIQAICWFINGRSSDDVNSTSSPEVGWAPEVCRGAWLPSTKTNVSDFLQINLGYEFYICAIATQGKPTADQWTTKYMIYTSLDNVTWTIYKENGTEKVFHGNTGQNDIVKHNLEEVIIASFIRFQPTPFFGHKALRVELYGALKSLVPIEAPILVNVTAQSSTSVAAFWKLSKRYYNERNLISFELRYQKKGSNLQLEIQTIKGAAWVDAKNVSIINGTLVFSTVVTGLEMFTEYEFKVCVFSSVGCGPQNSTKIARTWEDVPSKAPSNFTVTANTSTAIIAAWQLPSPDSRHGTIRGFKIFIRKEGSDINRLENISVSNITMYTKNVTGLAKFTRYGFHVLAFTSAGDGMNSSVEFARTKEDIPSNAPSGFMVTASTSTSVTALWQLPPTGSRNGIIKGFKLFINRKGSEYKPNVQLVNASNALVYTKNVTGLQESTEYELQVLAFTSAGDGPKSPVQVVKTLEVGFSMASILGFSIGGVFFLGFLLLVRLSCRKKRRKTRPAKWTAKDIKPLNSCQIPPERIELLEEVGQGAFGKVHKAKLIDGLEFFKKNTKDRCEKIFKYKIVAVKELHENANEKQKLDFLNEIELMKLLGKSPNVLRFVGCWTETTPQKTPFRLIIEYVPHGDLLHWLRAKRSQIKGSTLGAALITESKKQYAETKECNTATLDQGGEADGIKTDVLYENSCISTCASEPEEIIASGNIDSASPLMCFPSTSAEDHRETITSSSNECVIPLIAISCPTTSGEGQTLPSDNDECTIPFLSLPSMSGEEYDETIASDNIDSASPLMCLPSTSAEDHKETITSSSNECVIPLITVSCPTTSGKEKKRKKKKALPSGNDECTIPFLSLPTISGEEYDETIGDDEGELIGDINDESGIPLLGCSSTYPAGNEGTDIADGNNAIPFVVVSSSASNQEDVPTKNMGDECDEDCESFAPLDLIKLAWQIARGMKGLVHRDLAARNILVGHGKKIKIADFGLMRQLYHEVYEEDTEKKLPVKWMAPESIFEDIFTTKSDVWSYGVVLWEIATLGGSPYAQMKHKEVLESLMSGYRLEKPDMCTDRVYTLMTECWNQDPDERPSFQRLYNRLDDMLEEQGEYFNWDNHDETKYYYSKQASKTAEVDELNNLEVANLPDVSTRGSNASEADEPAQLQVENPLNVSIANLAV